MFYKLIRWKYCFMFIWPQTKKIRMRNTGLEAMHRSATKFKSLTRGQVCSLLGGDGGLSLHCGGREFWTYICPEIIGLFITLCPVANLYALALCTYFYLFSPTWFRFLLGTDIWAILLHTVRIPSLYLILIKYSFKCPELASSCSWNVLLLAYTEYRLIGYALLLSLLWSRASLYI